MKGKRKAWINNYAQLEGVSSPAPGRGARPPGPLPGSGEGVPGSGKGVPGSEKPLPVRGGALGSETAVSERDTPTPEVFAFSVH